MKKLIAALILVGVIMLTFALWSYLTPTKTQIRAMARQSSVQPMFYHPVLRVSFRGLNEQNETPVEEIIDEKIKEALEAERDLRESEKEVEDKYAAYLTTISEYGVESPSRTDIPIGSIPGVPEWAKFPEKVLVVHKIETAEINEHDEEFADDVQVVSETANVSLSIAKDIMTKLRSDGYTISKDEIVQDEKVELLHFSDGWADSYPDRLSWQVIVEGSENNIITGYDSRGIIQVSPIPEDAKVFVRAGYYDLKDEFKPVSDEIKRLQDDLEDKKDRIERLEKELDELRPEEKYGRDIRLATMWDVIAGIVELEQFWIMSGGSGVLLGNYDFGEEHDANHWRTYGVHIASGGMVSLVLTNAHVAANALNAEMMVNEELTVMYIILPGRPYIRHTTTSDRMGSPAAVLFLNGDPVISPSIDAAIMVTSKIPGTDRAAPLGDSDKVRVGEPILSVGNPMLLSKFTTMGVVSNTDYNLLQSPSADWIFPYLRSGSMYDGLVNACFWLDCPVGIGGVSGSGVWSLRTGKVVALRNSGMASRDEIMFVSDTKKLEHPDLPYDLKLSNVDTEHFDVLFDGYPLEDVKFDSAVEGDFAEIYEQSGGFSRVAGMNIGIPINLIKAFLQERGLDPDELGFKPVKDEHWTK
jgi:hypothetical protein